MIRRTITLLTITGLLTFQWALPALAYGQDYGTAYCGSNNIAVRHRTYGQTFIQVPNGTTVDTRNYPTFKVSTTTTLQSGMNLPGFSRGWVL